MPMTDSFTQFRQQLGQKLNLAHRAGASRGTILNAAKDFTQWLAEEVPPQNHEQRLLKEMWDVADESERSAMTNVLVKFIDEAGGASTGHAH